MIHLKKDSEIAKMRESGRIVARTIRLLSEAIVPGKTTTKELDDLAERLIREQGGVPSFLNYRDSYPASACISVNEVVIHGIPNERVLQEGDIIDIDLGVCKDGYHADSAWTFAVGTVSSETQRLLNVTQEAMWQGIAKARPGNRIGDVSATIQRYVESNGYSVVRELLGHGIGRNLHEEPNVPNYGRPKEGPWIKPGLTICIEPMVNQGTRKIVTLDDGWTVVTEDGKLSAHFEHTVAVTKDGPEILTVEN
ncbi:MAG: type I methionyl aminopeptidase [Fimbriimonadaceae bacterium]|nr:type I methionyl aminopeptidase [Fimbriimonadaceae bacterium]QYK55912.1 MAG: type I methionyl aminopeptidase [Fimbriimonadaceae bacterium]